MSESPPSLTEEGPSPPPGDPPPSNLEFDPSLGSMDNLDTIALTTSPTMESLDLGDTKSLDSLRLDPPCQTDESIDEDKGIEITVEGGETHVDNIMEKVEKDPFAEVVQPPEAESEDNNVEGKYDKPTSNEKVVDIVSEVTVAKPEPRICDYFAAASGNDFDSIVQAVPEPDVLLQEVLDDKIEPEVLPEPHVLDNQDSKSDTEVEITRQKHKSGSTIVETPSCSFEGESALKDIIGSVSDLVMDQGEKKAEFFESFTAEEAEKDTEDVQAAAKKPSYVMPHLSPGPSPGPSAYASPIHHSRSEPISIPSDVSIASSPRAPPTIQQDAMDLTSPFAAPTAQDIEDPFSASLKMSEADRRRDAWIPSDLTKMTLVSMMTNAPGTFYPRQDQLTMPGILLDERQGDPVVELMYKCMSEHDVMKRQTLTADMVSQDEDGLRKLIRGECYRSALDLTSKLLTLHGQGAGKLNLDSKNTPDTLQLWLVRVAMLMKLKLYQVAESELAPFGNFDKPDMYYEFYPDLHPGRKGCMVPFSLRILHAELPHFLGRSQDALDRLYYIHAIVKKILMNLEAGLCEDGAAVDLPQEKMDASRDLWRQREVRLFYSIVNVLIGAKTYDSAVELLETLREKDEKNQVPLISTLGRLYLQMGDLSSARQQFTEMEKLLDVSDDLAHSHLHMNRGFVALGQNDFEAAKACFQRVVELDPGNGVAVNNMAVCSLYTGKLREALHVLESLVQANPARYLQDCILINLCTLYELESSRAIQKKQRLLQMVAEYKGNGFNVHCLKMGELMAKK